jgi:hypothetical protein
MKGPGNQGTVKRLKRAATPQAPQGLATQRRQSVILVLFFAFLSYVALLLFPVKLVPFDVGLDPAYQFAANYFLHTNFRYGPDIVFTYGPLGYLEFPLNLGHNLLIGVIVQTASWAILVWQLAALFQRGGRGRLQSVVLLSGLALASGILTYFLDCFLLGLLFVLLLVLENYSSGSPASERGVLSRPEPYLVVIICGALLLMKLTAYMIAVIAVAGYILRRIGYPPRRPPLGEAAFMGAVILSGPAAYLIYNPSFVGLFDFIKGSVAISSGYSAAMSFPTRLEEGVYLLVVGAVLLVMLAMGMLQRALSPVAAVEVAVLAWIAEKHGFVRADEHPALFFGFAALIAAYAVAQIRFSPRSAPVYLAIFALLLGLAVMGGGRTSGSTGAAYWSLYRPLPAVSAVLHWDDTIARFEDSRREVIRRHALPPETEALIRGKRVLIFPSELSYGVAGNFELEPLYTLQSYSSYTQYLDRETAATIQRRAGLVDLILLDWSSIDNRHPLLDVPATWRTMYRFYAPVGGKPNGLVAARRISPLADELRPFRQTTIQPGEWMAVPESLAPLSASLDLRPTFAGAVRTFLYKLDEVWLEVETRSGSRQKFRIVPDVLKSPFPLNWLPLNTQGLERIWRDGRVDDPVQRIRWGGDGARSMRTPAAVTVYEDRAVPVTVIE